MKLKEWRVKKKMSQEQFAIRLTKFAKTKISQRTISAWERGVLPRKEWLIAIDKYTDHKVRDGDFV